MEETMMASGERPRNLVAPGHSACLGCGEVLAARLVLDAAGPNVIVANATGCLEVTTSRYPESAWEVPWIHSLFDNAAAVAAGVESALRAMGKRDSIKVIAQGGDGATDIGFGPLSGMMERGHDVLYICYDNEAYMNTGVQRSGLTPRFSRTSTSPAGRVIPGNPLPKKDFPAIAAAHGCPYVATASVAYTKDLTRKVQKALATEGPKYLQIHVPCPLGWGFDTSQSIELARLAVQTGLYPIFEMENGAITGVIRVPKPKPVTEYLEKQVRFRHLLRPGAEKLLAEVQAVADRNIEKYGLSKS